MYFDIDSTYRNRNNDPNPADFAVLPEQAHICCDNEKRDLVSLESILFPAFDTPPVAFYYENLVTPGTEIDAINERTNLPFMYRTGVENVYQLDELVIASTNPFTTDIVFDSVYPRGSIPLGEADQYYTGDTLENFVTNETRTITSFYYDKSSSDNLFQTCTVLWSSTLSGITTIAAETISTTTIPVSNIDRYYQGKYIRLVGGDKRLITNYTVYDGYAVFTVDSQFNSNPSPGDTFQIVSDRKWFVTVDSPFSTSIPQYPAYRLPLPSSTLQFDQYKLYTSSNPLSNVHIIKRTPGSVSPPAQEKVLVTFMEDNSLTDTNNLHLANVLYGLSNDPQGVVWQSLENQVVVYNAPEIGNLGVVQGFDPYDFTLINMESSSTQPTVSVTQNVPVGIASTNTILADYKFGSSDITYDDSIYFRDLLAYGTNIQYSFYNGQDSVQITYPNAYTDGWSIRYAEELYDLDIAIIEFDYATDGVNKEEILMSIQDSYSAPPTFPTEAIIILLNGGFGTFYFTIVSNNVNLLTLLYNDPVISDTNWHKFKLVFGSKGVFLFVDNLQVTPTFFFGNASTTACFSTLNQPLSTRMFWSDVLNPIAGQSYVSNFRISSYPFMNSLSAYMFSYPEPLNTDASGNGVTPVLGLTNINRLYTTPRVSSLSSALSTNCTLDFSGYLPRFTSLTDLIIAFYIRIDDPSATFELSFTTANPGRQFSVTYGIIDANTWRLYVGDGAGIIDARFITTRTDWYHICAQTGISGNILYVNGDAIPLQYVAGNPTTTSSVAYVNGLTAITAFGILFPSSISIDSLYFINESVLTTPSVQDLVDSNPKSRWNERMQKFDGQISNTWFPSTQASFYNFSPTYGPGVSNLQLVTWDSNNQYATRIVTDDVLGTPLPRIVSTVVTQSTVTKNYISDPIYGTPTLHITLMNGDQLYILYSVYRPARSTLIYYVLVIELTPFDTFTSSQYVVNTFFQAIPSNVVYTDTNRYKMSMIRVNSSTFYTTILVPFNTGFSYTTFLSTNAGVTWNAILNTELITLAPNPVNINYGTQLLYIPAITRLIVFIYDATRGLTYYTTDNNGATSIGPISLDSNPRIFNVEVIDNDGVIQMAYTRQNSDGTYSVVMLSEQQFEFTEAVPYRIRRNPAQIIGRYTTNPIASATTNTVTFTSASATNDLYTGMFLWLYNEATGQLPTSAPFEMINSTYRITSYNGATKTATVIPALPDLSVIALQPNSNDLNWEILGNVRDSFSGMNYVTNSMLSDRCYSISLDHVILPNATLLTGIGNQVSFYPYIYVKFTSIDNTTQNSFYSNNPYAKSVTFKVPVSQFTNDPSALPFIRLSGDNRPQTRMDINKGFRVSVLLPNGEPFVTVLQDNAPPDLPNPFLQVSLGITFSPNNRGGEE